MPQYDPASQRGRWEGYQKQEEQMHAQRNGCHALQTSAVAASLLRAGWKTLRV